MRDTSHSSLPTRKPNSLSGADDLHALRAGTDGRFDSASPASSVAELLRPETRDDYLARRSGDSSLPGFSRPIPAKDLATNVPPEAEATDIRPIDRANQMIEQLTRSLNGAKQPSTRPAPLVTNAAPPSGAPLPTHADYEILRELSRSQSAVVYEAYDRTLRRYVAIKQLNEQFRADPRQSELFWHEARFLAGLVHENVCRVYAVNEQQAWIVMEMMTGSLDQRLAEGPLPCDLVRSILRQALQGLRYLHEQGKLHGEIKPSKLLLDEEGCVKLSASAGFSLGGEFRRPTGTQKYVAPELLRPEVFGEVSPGVDLYCLGLTALELLMGDRFSTAFKGVHDADDDLAWMRWHCSPSEKLPPLEQLIPQLPADMAKTLTRMLAKPVSDRYESAAAALQGIEEKPIVLVDVPQKTDALGVRPHVAPKPVQIGARPNISPTPWPQTPQSPPPTSWSARLSMMAEPEFWKRHSNNPKVLYSILGAVALAMCVLMLGSSPQRRSLKTVEVAFKSTPLGAQVSIDGHPPAIAAPGKAQLSPGLHTLRAEMPGYLPNEKKIDVKAGEPSLRLHFELAAAPKPVPAEKIKSPQTKPAVSVPHKIDLLAPLKPQRPDVVAVTKKPVIDTPAVPVKTETPPPTIQREIAADFATYAPQLIGDRLERDAYLAHLTAILQQAWEADGTRQACLIADEHFRAAQTINPQAPWADYAYGLLLAKNHKNVDALAHYEVAAETALAARIPLFAPLREAIRMQTLNEDYDAAARDSLRLSQAVLDFAAAGELGDQASATVSVNVEFVGRIMGFLKGPAQNKARSTVNLAAWEAELQALLPSDEWHHHCQVREEVLRQFNEQLAFKEEKEREFQQRVLDARSSGETRSVVFSGRINGQRSSERLHSRSDAPLFIPSDQGSSLTGQSNVQSNGIGSQQSTTLHGANQDSPPLWTNTLTHSRRATDWSRQYESTRHLDATQPQFRQPYILRTYLPEDYELRRMVFLTHLTQGDDRS